MDNSSLTPSPFPNSMSSQLLDTLTVSPRFPVMLTGSGAAQTTTTPTTPASAPQSPSRIARLRGFSYLRSYTQHLHSRPDADSHLRDADNHHATSVGASPNPASHLPACLASTTPITPPSPPTQPVPTTSVIGWLPALVSAVTANTNAARAESDTANNPNAQPTATTTSLPTTESSVMTRNSSEPMPGTRENGAGTNKEAQLPSIRFIPHTDPRSTRPSLSFQAISRTLPKQDSVIRVGRYSERDAQPGDIPRNAPSAAPVGFKSKVVSRRHCEFWFEDNRWFVKDVKSSSGTFLNHLRLSPPGVESRPWPLNDGDVVQLGIDFRGGEEMIFRCVKIRIELNRGWQKALNNFK
jgi:pSer/pThr/pTyr-binding forkhead associated (FHA) protein